MGSLNFIGLGLSVIAIILEGIAGIIFIYIFIYLFIYLYVSKDQ